MIMMQNQHRARARLDVMAKQYKWLFDALPEIRDAEARNWPDYVYVTLAALDKHISKIKNPDDFMLLRDFMTASRTEFLCMISAGLMWGTWRLTQGVYRFDEALYPHLINTQGTGEIPLDILCRLPEWCVYLETPGLRLPEVDGTSAPMYGAWVSLDIKTQGNMLALAIIPDVDCPDYEEGVTPAEERLNSIQSSLNVCFSTGTTVEEGIAASLDLMPRDSFGPLAYLPREEIIRGNAAWVKPIVNLLLYLCAGADYAGPAPQNPQPKKTKRGLRLFPPNSPTVWDVGTRMGSALRAAYAAQSASDATNDGAGRQVRPHIRRAHWHGFRSGARLTPEGQPIPAEKRRFDLRWLPPIAVNIDDMGHDKLPAVIHPVK